MSWTARAWRWHRWLGWLVGLQVLAWVSGGLLFAWLPFEPWVKGGDVLQRPALALTALHVRGAVVLPAVQAEFGVARADASLPYTLLMIGFGLGGLLMGRWPTASA
jgi:hypothetical protein